jgi:hypothetical protein
LDYDFKFDFNHNKGNTCKVLIPSLIGQKFTAAENFINIGLYSAHGLKNIGFMYGFGMRNEFYVKRLLLDHFELKVDGQEKDIPEE